MTTPINLMPWATGEQIEAFAGPYFATNPSALHISALKAFREATDRPVQSFQFAAVAERLSPIPILETAEAATSFLAALATQGFEWIAVFWDRGWGDDPQQTTDITVIQDGDGQLPLARVTPGVYRELCKSKVIAPNSLQTFKARRLHEYTRQAIKPSMSGDAMTSNDAGVYVE